MLGKLIASLTAVAAVLVGAKPVFDLIQRWRKSDSATPIKILPLDRKPRILIIDDDASDLEQSRLTLNGDYEVHTYRRQFKALADIALECDRGGAFDLIILDYMMEPLSGKEVADDIKGWQRGMEKRSKIVFFTRMGKMIDKPPGVAAVWRKGVDDLQLREKVKEILSH